MYTKRRSAEKGWHPVCPPAQTYARYYARSLVLLARFRPSTAACSLRLYQTSATRPWIDLPAREAEPVKVVRLARPVPVR